MVEPVKDTGAMIAGMRPKRDARLYVFCTAQGCLAHRLTPEALAMVQEDEGTSLILPLELAEAQGLETALPMVRITLQVHSALDGVGLTAAVATALAEAGIPCNMVAGYHHDHAFVPAAQAEAALACLEARAAQG